MMMMHSESFGWVKLFAILFSLSISQAIAQIGGSFCVSHPEQLLVDCKNVNVTALSSELKRELQHALWVQEIKIIDGDFPILTNIIPEGVPHLQHLEVLHIIRSQVVQVRVEAMMQVSSKLRQLSLAHNKLVAVPAAISLLEGLEVLDLRHNAITRLSSMLSRLPRLRTLKLDHNRIRQLVGWGSQRSPIAHLGLADNLIHEVWSESLKSFPELQRLDLSQNLLQRLPDNMKFSPTLVEVDLRGNPWHCDCHSTWLTAFQFQQEDNSMLLSLPLCSSPEVLRRQPLGALTEYELCTEDELQNITRTLHSDINNNQINLTDIGSRHFQLSWNVSDLSNKGQKVRDYLGWRVTFRPFGEEKESEVLLITLTEANARRRRTGNTSGHYTIRNLTPDTGYHLCFQTLSEGEVNNIIESRRRINDNKIQATDDDRIRGSDAATRGRSIDNSLGRHYPPEDVRRSRLKEMENEELKTTTERQEMTEKTTEPWRTSTRETETSPKPVGTNFVYTSDGHRIPINFAPPGVTFHPETEDLILGNEAPFSDSIHRTDPFIPNVPPPPPPTNFGESGQPVSLPFFRKKRDTSEGESESGRRCLEVITNEEDEIAVPVTVAATASSSTTILIFMICCCCFPKRCNRIRDSCIDKCKSVKEKTLIKSNSKTKTFVKPPKPQEIIYKQNLSVSTPDLRILEKGCKIEKEYRYQNLNKYHTLRINNMKNTLVELYPGYDLPKSATAKYFGYDFPKTAIYTKLPTTPNDMNFARRMSTDDNTSPTVNDRFVYYNLNKVKANLDIPFEQCKYSDKIKGLKYSPTPSKNISLRNEFTIIEHSQRKISNEEDGSVLDRPAHNYKNVDLVRSHSESDIRSFTKSQLTQPLYYNLLSKVPYQKPLKAEYFGYDFPVSNKNILISQDLKLEKVREFEQLGPRRPTVFNINPRNETEEARFQSLPYSETDNTLQNGALHSPSALPIGEVAVSGGTLVEVPEGYVTPAKPRPINVLRIEVPANGS